MIVLSVALVSTMAVSSALACQGPMVTMASLIEKLEQAVKAVEAKKALARALSLDLAVSADVQRRAELKLRELRDLAASEHEDLIRLDQESIAVESLVLSLDEGSLLRSATREFPTGYRAREVGTRFDDWDLR